MAVFSNDLKWLIVNENERGKNVDGLDKLLGDLVKEANILSNNKKGLKTNKKRFYLLELEYRYNGVVSILKMYTTSKNKDILEVINEFGIKYCSKDCSVSSAIDNVFMRLKGLKNKINIARLALQKLESNISNDDDVMASLDNEALVFETFLELGYFVNKRVVSVERWIGMRKMATAKNEQLMKINN